jgi:hypothetical protein
VAPARIFPTATIKGGLVCIDMKTLSETGQAPSAWKMVTRPS